MIRLYARPAATALVAGWVAFLPAGGPPPAAAPVPVWRSALEAGEWLYFWSRAGDFKGAASLTRPSAEPVALEAYSPGWPRPWWRDTHDGGWRVPKETKPGEYTLRMGPREIGPVTVVAPLPPASWITLSPDANADDTRRIAEALARGHVLLNPGTYVLKQPLPCTAGRTLRGYGAVLLREPDRWSYRETMVLPAARCRFEGLTFRPMADGWAFGWENRTKGGHVTVSDCTFRGGVFGFWSEMPDLLVERCEFVNASMAPVVGGMWLHCRSTGLPPAHGFVSEGNHYPLAVLGLTMDGTDRGLVLRSGWAPFNDALFAGLDFRNINRVPNGNELITTEGGPKAPGVSRCLFFHIRASNCESQINFWDAKATDNLLWDGALDHCSVCFSAIDADQTGNVVRDFELRGGGVQFAPRARGNRLERVACVGWRPTRANQPGPHPRPMEKVYANWPGVIMAEGPGAATNTVVECLVRDQPAGMPGFAGVTKK